MIKHYIERVSQLKEMRMEISKTLISMYWCDEETELGTLLNSASSCPYIYASAVNNAEESASSDVYDIYEVL